MKKVKLLAVLNAIALVVAILFSYGSNARLFNSKTIGEVSDKYEALFVPAGFTFAIWGLIYTALIAFVIYHLIRAFQGRTDEEANKDVETIGWWFIVNCLASAAWVLAWVNEWLAISVALMLIQLVTLIIVNIKLHIYSPYRPFSTKLLTQFPLAIYFAWINIATIANISSALLGIGWDGKPLSAVTWTIILIALGALLSLFVIFIRRNVFFGLVVIWAIYGIIYKRMQAGEDTYQDIINAGWSAILLLTIAVIVQTFKNYRMKNNREKEIKEFR